MTKKYWMNKVKQNMYNIIKIENCIYFSWKNYLMYSFGGRGLSLIVLCFQTLQYPFLVSSNILTLSNECYSRFKLYKIVVLRCICSYFSQIILGMEEDCFRSDNLIQEGQGKFTSLFCQYFIKELWLTEYSNVFTQTIHEN